jgi:hypothetical protein
MGAWVTLPCSPPNLPSPLPRLPVAALLSRQFTDMTRARVEGLLATFPKLVSDAAATGRQHTFVETDAVR